MEESSPTGLALWSKVLKSHSLESAMKHGMRVAESKEAGKTSLITGSL